MKQIFANKSIEPSGIFYLWKCKLENQLVIGLAHVEVAKVLWCYRSHPIFLIHKVGHWTIHPLITTFMPIPICSHPIVNSNLQKDQVVCFQKKTKKHPKKGKQKKSILGTLTCRLEQTNKQNRTECKTPVDSQTPNFMM